MSIIEFQMMRLSLAAFCASAGVPLLKSFDALAALGVFFHQEQTAAGASKPEIHPSKSLTTLMATLGNSRGV